MAVLLLVLKSAVTAGFVLIALVCLRDWRRYRDPSRAYLAFGMGALGAIALLGQVGVVLPAVAQRPFTVVVVVGFSLSGYALLLFRDSIVPLRSRSKRLAAAATIAGVAAFVALVVFPNMPPPVLFSCLVVATGVWTVSVGEPAVRFWLRARDLPAVQKARLRSLSAGYATIILILVLSVVASLVAGPAPEEQQSQLTQLGINILSLLAIPLLYVAFAPPRWLRRVWRDREEEDLSIALRDLVLFSADRRELGRRALEWASRLVGAEGGVVEDAGEVLATEGVGADTEPLLLARLGRGGRGIVSLGDGKSAILQPWELEAGRGGLAVVSGPFTPLFGADEAARLEQYAVAVTAALDRVRLVESLRRSEEDVRQLNVDLERRVVQRTAQLEASNKELEAFSYTVSHDLRAPLRAIDGFSRILQDEHREEVPEEARRYLDLVSGNAQDMGRLIDGLLTFSRLNRAPVQKQVLNPTEVAQSVADTLLAGLNGRHVEIAVHEMPPCRSDPILLQQVFANLLGNAVKFTRDRHDARVEVGCRPVESPADGGYEFFVRDNGVGFDMKYADKLFGVFQRLHGATEYEGTGAGLAIVQRIVHRHGGRVWADATAGSGATFYFTLGEDAVVQTAGQREVTNGD